MLHSFIHNGNNALSYGVKGMTSSQRCRSTEAGLRSTYSANCTRACIARTSFGSETMQQWRDGPLRALWWPMQHETNLLLATSQRSFLLFCIIITVLRPYCCVLASVLQWLQYMVDRTPWTAISSRDASTYTQDNTNRLKAHRHPSLEPMTPVSERARTFRVSDRAATN
jgi:hypothetical protein